MQQRVSRGRVAGFPEENAHPGENHATDKWPVLKPDSANLWMLLNLLQQHSTLSLNHEPLSHGSNRFSCLGFQTDLVWPEDEDICDPLLNFLSMR